MLAEANEREEATLAQTSASGPGYSSGDAANLNTMPGGKETVHLAALAPLPCKKC